MKLEVSHKEIVQGLTAFLASQGITGFDPATCQVTFSQKRGSGELSAVLDTDPAPEAPKEEKPATKPAAATAAGAGAGASTAAATTEQAKDEPKSEPQVETQAEPEVQTEAASEPATETAAGGDDDNLFD